MTEPPPRIRKKLIEVALPLDAINKAAAREKSIRHGHPSTLHLWWARRPLAAARAVIFAQMVDDPSEHVETLLCDPDRKRRAERELRNRQAAWNRRQTAHEEARRNGDDSVPEPGPQPTLDECVADLERDRLFKIIEDLVKWENTTNEEVLQRARDEIWESWRRTCAENADHPRARELFDRHKLPAFHDPFAGGGALPLEAQRLGLEAYASDLNPVAVLINKAMIEIPPRFAGRPPVNPDARQANAMFPREWKGAQGLAEDVRYYGKWMRDEAEKRIGHLYPKVEITPEMVAERPDLKPYLGQKLTVIAWIWARTVKSPNPAFADVDVPLASTFMLSTKPGKEAYVDPVVGDKGYHFTVKVGQPEDAATARNGTKHVRANFSCLVSGTPISGDYVQSEGRTGRLGARMMAIVAEGDRGRVYLAPTPEMEAVAEQAEPTWKSDVEFFQKALGFRIGNYGMTKWGDLFTPRQLVALTTFSDLVQEARAMVKRDAVAAGHLDHRTSLWDSGADGSAYADAVAVYLAFAMDKSAEGSTTLCTWSSLPSKLHVVSTFGRQALPMSWDFAEANVFADSSGNILRMCELTASVLERQNSTPVTPGVGLQADVARLELPLPRVVSTDPPYYDNIGYADLSDFFYVWLRRTLGSVFPQLFMTVAVPKVEELVATPERHGGKEEAEEFFLNGMTRAMHRIAEQAHPAFPVTIYYAFKQSESNGEEGITSTGWDTFLDAVVCAGFAVSGTWPVRTERSGGFRNRERGSLASSIVLVCRPRAATASIATRREFINALKTELPEALLQLQRGSIAPVDLAQVSIGPGMAVFTRFTQVLDAEGKPLSVRRALGLINQALDEIQTDQESDFDSESRWAIAWFTDHGFDAGQFPDAHTYFIRYSTAENALKEAGIIDSGRGKVRLLKPEELRADWDPASDSRLTAWESVHHLIRALETGGEGAAATLVAKLGAKAEVARELAYRLYTVSERKKRPADALAYNGLVQSWPEIARLAGEERAVAVDQTALFGAEA